jgi:hypothetical protein
MSEPPFWCRSCKSEDSLGESLIDAIYEKLKMARPDNPNLYNVQIPPVVDCPCWRTKDA